MTQADEKSPIQSLLNELADVDSLLSSALTKAKHLENNPRLAKYNDQISSNSSVSSAHEEAKLPKPSNWGQLKDLALEDSMRAMEEDATELAADTTKVRQVKPKNKKLRIDDNWEDDPI